MATTTPKVQPGPKTLYAGKVRRILSWTATPTVTKTLRRNQKRLKLSRSDFLCLLVDRFAESLTK